MSLMKENVPGSFGQALILLCVGLLALNAVLNVWRGEAAHPERFLVALPGCALFAAAKLSVVRRGHWLSFGTGPMTPAMANAYRTGYWLMCLGAVLAFA